MYRDFSLRAAVVDDTAAHVAARDPSVAILVIIDLLLPGRLLDDPLVPFLQERPLRVEDVIVHFDESASVIDAMPGRGFEGGKATFYRWSTAHRQKPARGVATSPLCWPPSRRVCAWLLSEEPSALDDASQRFLHRLFKRAPELRVAGELARGFDALIRGEDEAALDTWIAAAAGSELEALAKGIGRDIDAVITYSWSTSPVEGRINRLKTLKRQMYGRAEYELMRIRMLTAA